MAIRHRDRNAESTASWRSLPRKDQLAILFACRLVDFFQIASLQSYMFYQIQSFDPDLPKADLFWRAGLLNASFTATQCMDSPRRNIYSPYLVVSLDNFLLVGVQRASTLQVPFRPCSGSSFSEWKSW